MLHMILGILKIFGILLGILFLLLLAAVLALVFVPIRYRLAAMIHPEQCRVSLKGSWLLHIISAEVSVDPSDGPKIALRLFGIRFPLFHHRDDSSTGNKEKKTRRKRNAKAVKSGREKQKRTRELTKSEQKKQKQIAPKAEKCGQPQPETGERGQIGTETEERDKLWPKIEKQEQAGPETEEREPDKLETEGQESRESVLQKIWFQCRRICDKIRQLAQRIRQLGEKLARLKQRTAELGRKGIVLLHKPGELLRLAEEYEAKEVFGGLVGQLMFLISHYKPRRIQGYLRFGLEDPSTTGQLTGLIYLLLPARADHFSVEPQFNEPIFETETVCSGHIRALHVLRVLWRGFRDKKLRRMIKKLSKKGDS